MGAEQVNRNEGSYKFLLDMGNKIHYEGSQALEQVPWNIVESLSLELLKTQLNKATCFLVWSYESWHRFRRKDGLETSKSLLTLMSLQIHIQIAYVCYTEHAHLGPMCPGRQEKLQAYSKHPVKIIYVRAVNWMPSLNYMHLCKSKELHMYVFI